jgi:peptide/nickel transport system substrate-binding protein
MLRSYHFFLLLTPLIGWACSNNTDIQGLPRDRSLVMDCTGCRAENMGNFNPLTGGTRAGQFVFEPLYYYNAFSLNQEDNLIPWIAESHQFNDDYTEVTVKICDGVEWSDGEPWTAHDRVFTLNMLKAQHDSLNYVADMKNWLKEAVAKDDLTAQIFLNAPNPRFVFTYLTYKFNGTS